MPGDNPSFIDEQERLRLLTALRESEILRELGELLASSLDLNRILQVLVKRTTDVCEVERCAVWLLDEQRGAFVPATYHISTSRLDSQAVKTASHVWYRSTIPLADPAMQRLLDEKGLLFLEELRSEPSMHFVADTFLVRSVLLLALIRDGQPVGLMSLDNPDQARTFSAEQVQLARAIAQQAAIAIGNGRLYQQAQVERRRAEQLIKRAQAINQVAMAVNRGEDLADILEIALTHLVQGVDASGGAIVLLEGATPVVLSRKHLKASEEGEPTGIALSSLPHYQQSSLTGTPLFIHLEETEGAERSWYQSLGLAHTMIIPLMAGAMRNNGEATRQERHSHSYCLGFAIAHYSHAQHAPARGQFAFAQDIAAQCALAIEKQRLLEDSHQAAALAMERANTLDAVFQSLAEGITVITQDGEVLIRNTSASYFLGVSVNAVDTVQSLLARFPTYTLDGERIPMEEFPISRALRGERIRGERFVTHRADGIERVIEINVTPMFDNTKQQIGVASAFRDVTEQVQAETRIQHALETMLHVAEAVSGVTDIDDILSRVLQLTLNTLNCERGVVYMHDSEQQAFMPLLSAGIPVEEEMQLLQDQSSWLASQIHTSQSLKGQLAQGHATLVKAEQFRRSAEPLPLPSRRPRILAAPITHNDRLLGLMLLERSLGNQRKQAGDFSVWDMAIIEGISQLAGLAIQQARLQEEATNARANEAAMREANALKDDFLSITAHEFRTPLTVILAHSQMLLRSLRRTGELGQDKKDSMGDSLSTIEEQTHLLTNIVNSFLEVTQINRGQLELKFEPVDLAEIARQVVANYSATSSGHELSCVIEPDENEYQVMGDSARLFQIMANLVQNAIKYSPLGGPVTVRLCQRITNEDTAHTNETNATDPTAETRIATGENASESQTGGSHQTGRSIEVCVEDRGIGIPKDAQARLFERFYRAPNTQGSKVRGIGLGLYLVAELLRLHGGTIRVESSGFLGEGSRFIFILPVLERDVFQGE